MFNPIMSKKMVTQADAEAELKYYIQQAVGLMNFPAVWNTASGNGMVVAVLDTGLKIDHNEFCPEADDPDASDSDAVVDTSTAYLNECTKVVSPRDMIEGVDFSSEALSGAYPINGEDYDTRDYYPDDDIDGHGTHVSGIVGAPVNDTGITGAAFGASIMPIKVLFPFQTIKGSESALGLTSDIAAGIDYAVSENADVINMSLGADGSLGVEEDYIMLTAIQGAISQGVIVIAAAGNSRVDIDSVGRFLLLFQR